MSTQVSSQHWHGTILIVLKRQQVERGPLIESMELLFSPKFSSKVHQQMSCQSSQSQNREVSSLYHHCCQPTTSVSGLDHQRLRQWMLTLGPKVQEAKMKNFVWLLARMSNPENQTISSWTGFNIQIRDNVVVIQDTVSYLPTINAPATAMSTLNEVLNQTLTIIKSLHLNQIE